MPGFGLIPVFILSSLSGWIFGHLSFKLHPKIIVAILVPFLLGGKKAFGILQIQLLNINSL